MFYSRAVYPETDSNYFTCYRCEDRPVFKASYLLRSHCMRIHNQDVKSEYRSSSQDLSYNNITSKYERFSAKRAASRERLHQCNSHLEKRSGVELQSQTTLEENIDVTSVQYHLEKQEKYIKDMLDHHKWLTKVILKFESESDSSTKQRLPNLLQSKVTLQNEIKNTYTDVESLKNICDKLDTKGSENTTNTTYTKRQEKLTLEVHQLSDQQQLKKVTPIMKNSESQTEENNQNSELLEKIDGLEIKLQAKTILMKENIKERALAETTIFFLKEDLSKKESQLSETRLKVKAVEGEKDKLEATTFELEQKCLKSQSKLNLACKEIAALKGSTDLNNLKEAQYQLQKARNICKIFEENIGVLKKEKEESENKIIKLQDDIAKLQDSHNNYENSALTTELKKIKKELKEGKSKEKCFEEMLKKQELDLANLQEKINDGMRREKEKDKIIEELKQKLKQAPLRSNQEKSRHVEDPRKLELEYQSILSEKVTTVKQCCELVKELEAELNKAEDFAQIIELKDEVKSLLDTQNQADLEIKQILQKIEELQTEEGNKSCLRCEVNLRSLYEKNATLQHDLTGKDATIILLENEKERLTENLNMEKEQKIQTSDLLSDVKSENKKMQKELSVIRKHNKELEQRLQVSEVKKTELLTEIQTLKKDSEAQEQLYKSKNNCALHDIATLKEKCVDLEKKLTERVTEANAEKQRAANLQDEIDTKNEECENYVKKIKNSLTENAELKQEVYQKQIQIDDLNETIVRHRKDFQCKLELSEDAKAKEIEDLHHCVEELQHHLKMEEADAKAASDKQNKQMKECEQSLNVARMEIEELISKISGYEELSERLKIQELENEEKDEKIAIFEEELDKLRKVIEMKEKRIKDEKEQHKTEFQELLKDKDEECKSLSHTLHLKESIIDQYENKILHLQEQNRQIVTTDEESYKLKVMLREKEKAIQELERDLQLSENNISTLNQSIADVKNQLDEAQKKLTLRKEEGLTANERFNEMQARLANLQKEIEVTACKDNQMEKEIQKLKAEILETKENKITEIAKANLEVRELENKHEILKKYAEGLLRENDQLKLQARNKDEAKFILDQQPEYVLLFYF